MFGKTTEILIIKSKFLIQNSCACSKLHIILNVNFVSLIHNRNVSIANVETLMHVRSTVAGTRPVLSFRYGDVLYGSVMGNKWKWHLESESF